MFNKVTKLPNVPKLCSKTLLSLQTTAGREHTLWREHQAVPGAAFGPLQGPSSELRPFRGQNGGSPGGPANSAATGQGGPPRFQAAPASETARTAAAHQRNPLHSDRPQPQALAGSAPPLPPRAVDLARLCPSLRASQRSLARARLHFRPRGAFPRSRERHALSLSSRTPARCLRG